MDMNLHNLYGFEAKNHFFCTYELTYELNFQKRT